MRVVVIGAGAVGSFLAWAVAAGGGSSVLVRRSYPGPPGEGAHLTIVRPDGSSGTVPVGVAGTLAGAVAAGDPPDLAIVAVKQHDLPGVLASLSAADGLPVLTVQNGVGAEAAADETLRDDRPLLAGSITASLERRADGTIGWLRSGGLALAPVRTDAEPLLRGLAGAVRAAGVRVVAFRRHEPMKWSKLVANLVGNASSALLDRDVASIYADPALFAVERDQLREALAVMRARGTVVVDLPGAPVRLLALAARLPAPLGRLALGRFVGGARGGKDPSLRAAVGAGGPTEVAWLNGAVATAGAAAGVDTPVNAALARLVDEAAGDPARRDWFRGRPDRLLEALGRG